jgi:hypothetical protein
MIIIKIQTYGSGCPGCSSSNIRLEWLPSSNWGPDPSRLNKSPFVDDDGGGGREEARKRKKKSQKEMKEKREREREVANRLKSANRSRHWRVQVVFHPITNYTN